MEQWGRGSIIIQIRIATQTTLQIGILFAHWRRLCRRPYRVWKHIIYKMTWDILFCSSSSPLFYILEEGQPKCWNTFSSYLVVKLGLNWNIFWLNYFFVVVVWLNSSAALRDLWWNRLGQAVKDERDKEPKTTTIQITYHDAVQAIGYVSYQNGREKKRISFYLFLFLYFFFFCGLFIKWIGLFGCWLCSGHVLSSTSNRISV